MEWIRSLMLPAQGSAYAAELDNIYMGLFWLCAILFLGITFATLYFSWRFRYVPGRVTPHITHNDMLEITWTVIPLLICVVIFFVGLKGWMEYSVAPGDAMEVQVTAKKWLWQFEYPDGSRTINDLHVPIGKNVKFVMTSEDVLHDFYVPVMRVKHDVIPGRYTQVWFNPTVLGTFTITCAEYCGKGHSDMMAKLTVENQKDFEKFLETGGTEWEEYRDKNKWPEWGKIQWERKGCNSCHSIDGSTSKGPSWKGIWGKMEMMNNGVPYKVDEAYLRESMMNPQAKIVKGFEPVMPTFQGLLRDHEIKGLIEFIKTLQ
jgi:cytochrome c oxidase subunit II